MATKNDLLDAFALLEERAPTSCRLPGEAQTRRPRRRQRAAIAAVVVAVLAIATGIALLADHGGPTHQQPATSAAPTTTRPSPTASPSPMSACTGTHLRARIAVQGSMMSQPFIVVELRNTATVACMLRGYPALTARSDSGPMRIRVQHGVYERVDPGPHTVTVRPGGTTAFAVGTASAYGGGAHLITVRELTITVPGDTTPIRLPVTGMAASGPPGAAIPVGVTAFGTSVR